MKSPIEISVVTPVYKAQECVEELYGRLVKELEKTVNSFEIIMVNDFSPDESWRLIEELAHRDRRVVGINLSRNFGQHYAITAGLDHARGNWVVVMDCDLQHLPEDIGRLYRKAMEGYDIVFVKRTKRHDPYLKRVASRLFGIVYNLLSEIKLRENVSTFSIVSARVAQSIRSLKEGNRNYGFLLQWVGYDVAIVEGEHARRFAGKSSYGFWRSVNHAIESLCSQSNRPLQLSIQFGFLLSFLAVSYAIWLAIGYYLFGVEVAGWTSVMVSMFFLSGLLFANIGVLGLYLGKVFDQTKDRPLYIVKDLLNVDVEHAQNGSTSFDSSVVDGKTSV